MKKLSLNTVILVVMLVICLVVTAYAGVTVSITRSLGTVDSLERIRDFTVTFDSSYPTGGEAFAASDIALTSIYNLACQPTDGYTISYNYTSALLVYDVSENAGIVHQLANATDISNLVVRCRATGK